MRAALLLGIFLCFAVTGCSNKEAPLKPCKAVTDCEKGMRCQAGKCRKPRKKDKKKVMNGSLHFQNKSIPVTHYVSHDAKRDLFIQCRARMDADKKAGREAKLCYDPKPAKPTSIRIEHGDRKALKARLLQVRADNEGYHFVIESSGSIVQVLDMAYAPRRNKEIRPGEILIISSHKKQEDTLLKSLKATFPGLKHEVTELKTPPAPKAHPHVEKK